MDIVEQFFRFAGISLLMVLALVLFKDHRDKPAGLMVIAWAISGLCYIAVVPAFRDWGWEIGSNILLVGSLSWPVLFWLVAKLLFQDNFKPGWVHLGILLVIITVSFFTGAPAFRAGFAATSGKFNDLVVPQTLVLVFVALALYAVLKDWRNDLVENRRMLRLVLLAATGFVAIVTGAAMFILLGMPEFQAIQWVDTIHTGLVFMLCVATSVAFYQIPSAFFDPSAPPIPAAVTPPDDHEPIVTELNRLIREEQVYFERGLTIGRLAAILGEKEYKIRRIINGEFGYRNFNEFLNQHRIAEAARRLVAADTRRLPILTIALDVGYSSLAPFNRAFKQQLNMTPTEFRTTSKHSSDTPTQTFPNAD